MYDCIYNEMCVCGQVCAWGMACLADVGLRSRGRFEEELLHADVIAIAPRTIATIQVQDNTTQTILGTYQYIVACC